ncbi:unnamed protein product [Ascophyllum nodosum]
MLGGAVRATARGRGSITCHSRPANSPKLVDMSLCRRLLVMGALLFFSESSVQGLSTMPRLRHRRHGVDRRESSKSRANPLALETTLVSEEVIRVADDSISPTKHTRRRDLAKAKIRSAVVGASERHAFDAEIFALALPTLGAVLVDPCLSLVDTGYVGRLGALSLAAVGPCAAAFNFVFVTASCAFLVSTSVLVSQKRAMGDREAIGRTIAIGSGLSVAVGVAVAALFYVYSSFLLRLMGAPEEVMGLAVPYLRWRASAFPANLFVLTASGAFRGMGEPKAGLINAIVIGVVNVVLDPLLMFNCGLGVEGAAIATAVAQWVGAVFFVGYIWRRREALGLAEGVSAPSLMEVKQFLGAGGAMIFRQLCNIGAWTVMASAATRMGIFEIAAHQLILSLWLVIAYVQDSIGSAGQVLVAQHMGLARDSQKASGLVKIWDGGAGQFRDTARSIAKRVLTLSFGLGLGLGSVARIMFPLFLPVVCRSSEVASLVSEAFPIILYAFPMCCLVWTWDSLFYGASDFIYNAKTVAVASSLGVAGSVLSLRNGWGVRGLWISMTYILFGARMAAHFWRFNSRRGPFGPSAFWEETRSRKGDAPTESALEPSPTAVA